MDDIIATYLAKEEKLFGGRSIFYLYTHRVQFVEEAPPPIAYKTIPRHFTVSEAVDYYNATEDDRLILQVFEENDIEKLQKMYAYWSQPMCYRKLVTAPQLLEGIFQHLREEVLCYQVSMFVGTNAFFGYRRALFELLISQQNPLSAHQKIEIAYYFLDGMRNIYPSEMEVLRRLLLNDSAIPDQDKGWVLAVLAKSDLANPEIIVALFDEYLQKYRNDLFTQSITEEDLQLDIELITSFLAQYGNRTHQSLIKNALEAAVDYYRATGNDYSYTELIEGYARIGQKEAVSYLQTLLMDFGEEVVQALGVAAAGTKDQALVQQLLSHYEERPYLNGFDLTLTIQQIIDTSDLSETAHLYPHEEDQIAVTRFLKHVHATNEELIEMLRTAEVIPVEVTNEELLEESGRWSGGRVKHRVEYLLEKAGVLFSHETYDRVPSLEYSYLLEKFTAYSRGKFCPEYIQQDRTANQTTLIHFYVDQTRVLLRPEHKNSCDCSTIAAAVNLTLFRQQSVAYFQEVKEGRGTETYVFATPEQMQFLSQEFGLSPKAASIDLEFWECLRKAKENNG